MTDIDEELAQISEKIREFAVWLEEQLGAQCAEDDYTEGCPSCDTGMAIKHLSRIRKVLEPVNPSQEGEKK